MTEQTPIEETVGETVVYDLDGKPVTAKEAEAQDKELFSFADQYFKNNPEHRLNLKASEEEDDTHIVKVNEEGEVVSETKEVTKEVQTDVIVEKEVTKVSMMEQLFARFILEKIRKETSEAHREISDAANFNKYSITDGHIHLDNLTDAYRKDISYINNLLSQEIIDVESIENDRIRKSIEHNMKDVVEKLFDFTLKYNTYKDTLEVLADDK